MSYIYVFGPNEEENDYSTMGLVGALEPTVCEFKETGNGENYVTLTHPKDKFGKYTALKKRNILVVKVPVRTTPEIQNGDCVTTVWTYKVKPLNQLTSKNQRTLYKKKTGTGRKKYLSAGDTVTVVLKPDDNNARWKVKSASYGEGWIDPNGFELVTEHVISNSSHAIEEIESPWTIREQYFRINEYKPSINDVTVTARHISYDLLYNKTRFKSEESRSLRETITGVLDDCYSEHSFEAFTNVENAQPGINYELLNPIDAFINPENGVCALYNVSLIRDNYSLYFLHDPGINRGVRIQYRKNMTGVSFEDSDDDVATRIIPIGETKEGDNLYLSDDISGHYIDSPLINEYPIPHVYELNCDNCKVGDKDQNGGTITKDIARARMEEQAKKLLENGCDKPAVRMTVEFINLGDTEEYRQFKNLENCFVFDYVIVQHPDFDIDVTAQIMGITWDCIKDRMKSADIGSIGKTLANTGITSWQIPNGFSGSKIASGTIGSAAFKENIIAAKHIQSESINTEALQAGSITSEKIAAGSVTADKLQADIIDAVSIEAVIAHIEKIVAEQITTDRLYAALASFDILNARTGNFDRATVEHLVANLFNLTGSGVMEDVFIHNLQLAYAQIVSASIGSLVLQDKNGGYYEIGINLNDDGTTEVTANPVYPSEDEKINGVYGTTKPIIATQMTVDDMAATTVKATQAVINKVIAARIDVDELFANNAFINKLVTSNIVSGKSLTIISEEALKAAEAAKNSAKTFRQETQPTQADNVKTGDIWVKPSTGEIYQANAVSFALDDEGNLYLVHEDDDGYYAIISADDPYFMEYNFDMEIAADGTYSKTPIIWSVVRDSGLAGQIKNNTTNGVDVEYCLWTSDTEEPYETYGGWQTVAPEQTEGYFIWSRTATYLKSGVVFYSDPVCISPSLGKNILSITEQYAIGDSKETAPDESAWKSTPDERGNGQYLWTRSLITFVDGTTTTTPPQVNTLWELEDSALNAKTIAESAGAVAKQAVDDLGNIPNYIDETPQGLMIKDIQGASIMKLNSGSVSIGTVAGAAQGFSQFAANYVQFGTYQLRRASDGGLVFRMI